MRHINRHNRHYATNGYARTIAPLFDRLRSGAWLTPERLRAYSLILLVAELLTMLFLALGTHGLIVTLDRITGTDFNSFYAAGRLVLDGHPLLAYDIAAHQAAERAIYGGADTGYNFFFYPPPMLLLVTPFAGLPYLVAFYVWETVQTAVFLVGIRGIVGRRATLLPYVAFPAAIIAYALGQNSLLTAGLLALTTVQLDRGRPWRAGLLLGCLCYKPHLALLVPVALLAGRQWRAIAGAALAVAAIVAVTTLAFSPGIWPAWLSLVTATTAHTFESGRIPPAGLISPFAAVLVAGGGPAAGYAVQAGFTAAAAATVAWVWWRCPRIGPRAAALLGGLLLAVPVILIYDMLPAAVAYAWIARDARATGWLAWERSFAPVAALVSLMARPLALGLHLPTAPLVGIGLLAIAWRRARAIPSAPVLV